MGNLSESINKFSTNPPIETNADAIVVLMHLILTIAIEILIAYIAYKLIKHLIRYGIDYYFKMKEYHDGRNAIDEIQQDIIRKHPKENEP